MRKCSTLTESMKENVIPLHSLIPQQCWHQGQSSGFIAQLQYSKSMSSSLYEGKGERKCMRIRELHWLSVCTSHSSLLHEKKFYNYCRWPYFVVLMEAKTCRSMCFLLYVLHGSIFDFCHYEVNTVV